MLTRQNLNGLNKGIPQYCSNTLTFIESLEKTLNIEPAQPTRAVQRQGDSQAAMCKGWTLSMSNYHSPV
eukprot:1158855-Pelagomonas_calceolata.AAC.15